MIENLNFRNIYNFDGNYFDYTSYIVNDHSKQSTNNGYNLQISAATGHAQGSD